VHYFLAQFVNISVLFHKPKNLLALIEVHHCVVLVSKTVDAHTFWEFDDLGFLEAKFILEQL